MAECVREWFAGRDPSGRNVRAAFAGETHPSAVVVPGLVAALDSAVGDIVVSFLAVLGRALLALAWLAGRIVRDLAPGAPAEVQGSRAA